MLAKLPTQMEGGADVLQLILPLAHGVGQLAVLLTCLVLVLHG